MEFVILTGVLITAIALYLFMVFYGSKKQTPKNDKNRLSKTEIQNQCECITRALESDNIASLKSAIILADKLVDYALQSEGFSGRTLAKRVKNARESLGDTYEKFWDAHRTRNRLVHEVQTEVRVHEAKEALKKYQEVLDNLGINPVK